MKLLYEIILKHPAGSLIACICLAVTGLVAVQRMHISLSPSARSPVLTISTELSGIEPEEIEILITRRIERALSDIPGLKEIQSVSREGESEVILRFHLGSDVSAAALEVRSRIRRLFPTFPEDTKFPVISFFDPSDTPLAVLGVTGGASVTETSQWVWQVLKPQLTRVNGVAGVQVSGTPVSEITVECDPGRLKALGMDVRAVAAVIRQAHKTLSGGYIDKDEKRLAIRTTGRLNSPDDIARLPISAAPKGSLVTIGDVAKVSLHAEPPQQISRLDGQPLVSVAIFRASGADQRILWKTVNQKLREIETSAPSGVKIRTVFSEAEELTKILNRFQWITVLSAVAAGCVVFLFIWSVASPILILSAVPFSLLVAILLMYLFKLEFDLLSLTGLVLAVGMLIDNGIVVVESISLRSDSSDRNPEAVAEAVEEVAQPVLYATLANIIVFFPLVFVSPEIRIFYVGLTWSVSLSLLASLVGSLVLIPSLFHYIGQRALMTSYAAPQSQFISTVYGRVLSVALDRPLTVFIVVIVIVAATSAIAPRLSFGTGASGEEEGFWVNVVMPPGTSTDAVDTEARLVEQLVLGMAQVKGAYSEVRNNQARLLVFLKKQQSVDSVISTLSTKLQNRDTAQFHFKPVGREGDDRTVSLNLAGPSLDKLMEYQELVADKLLKIKGVRDVVVQQGNPVPRQEFILRHDRLGFYGVSARDFADTLRGQFTGPVATRVMRDETETLVRVRAFRKDTSDLSPLSGAFLRGEKGQLIPLGELSEPTFRLAPSELYRKNRGRILRMELLLDRDNPLRLAQDITATMDRIPFDADYTYRLGEEIDQIIDTRREMLIAAALAILLTYLVLTASTESFLEPIVILTAIPCAASGVIVASMVMGFPITRPVYVAMIILVGLVINANILIVYAINDRLKEGDRLEDAVRIGAQRRIRPLMITTLTAIAGSIPMAFDTGEGASLWNPFANTLSAGLMTATLVSLILTPPLYLSVLRVERRVRRWRSGTRKEAP